MDVFALFSDKTAEKVLIDSFPSREKEMGLVLKTTISSEELKQSVTTSVYNAYLLLEKLHIDIPEKIGICVYGFSSSVTGNSADLAFALAFFAHLTKKGIIKPAVPLPLSIAATGVITERLSVERVGHIREKFLAAAQNKVEAVLYPFGNQSEIEELRKTDAEFAAIAEKMNLIPVKSLEDIFYEFGFLKVCQDEVIKKTAGYKLPIVLITTSFVFVLAVFIIVAAFNSDISKINYSAGLLDKTSNAAASLKTPSTVETTPNLPSPTLSEVAAQTTPKPAPVSSPSDIGITATSIYPSPTITKKPAQSKTEIVENQVPSSDTVAASGKELISLVGNISANLMNSGFATSKGDWVYFTDFVNVGLYKMKNDGSSVNRIQNAFATNINISEDNIYYLDTRSRGLFVIKTDGTAKKIHDDNFGMIRVSGEWIYYLNKNDNLIYKVRKNGLDRTPLCNTFQTSSENLVNMGISCSMMCVENNSVYFYAGFENKPEYNGIYRMNTDGSDKQIVIQEKCNMLSVEDAFIYFVASSDSSLYRVKTNGTGRQKLHEKVKTFNLSSGLIYFSTNDGLFKMNYNGDFISKLSNDPTNKINIASDWLYYLNSNDGNRLYRIRPNGTDKQSIGK